METVDDVIRSRIRTRKDALGVKLREVAAAAGSNESSLCNKLYGNTGFRAAEVFGIAQVLRCSTDYLFGLRDMTDEELHGFAENAYTAEIVNGNIVLRRMTVQQLLTAAGAILKKKGAGDHGR